MSFFDEAYRGTPPWDTGRPQTEFVRLAEEGAIKGEVLDVGCGTGENALFFAQRGLKTVGLDTAPLAIEKARRKAAQRYSSAIFFVGDALHPGEELSRKFDTITDSGLFHIFPDKERTLLVKSLHSTLKQNGTYFMLCFSDREPEDWGGPRRISRREILETFQAGWEVNWIREATFDSNLHEDGGRAWLSSITSKG